MSGPLRFDIGEIAVYAVSLHADTNPFVGHQCTILAIGIKAGLPFRFNDRNFFTIKDWDYHVDFGNGYGTTCMDYQLRKLRPPTEPEALTRTSDINEEAEV